MDSLTERDEARAALALSEVPGLGPRWTRRLVDHCGSCQAVLGECAAGRLPSVEGEGFRRIRGDVAVAMRRLRPVPDCRLRELTEQGIRWVIYGRPDYPERLTHLCDPPLVLYLRGAGDLPKDRAVAIVGSRKATDYGRRIAWRLATGLAREGWVVVSGMARGIDGSAHRATLEVGGRTVGILGSGLDHRFPWENRDLYSLMSRVGLLVSEFPPSEPVYAHNFPRRNRIIAALVEGVVVVQAGSKSGALNTANHALDLGRDVFAVPGPVGSEISNGVHGLLKDGAGLATCAEDILFGLGVPPRGEGESGKPAGLAVKGNVAAEAICHRLQEGPAAADDLTASAGLAVGSALALLSRLELDGIIRPLPGGMYELS